MEPATTRVAYKTDIVNVCDVHAEFAIFGAMSAFLPPVKRRRRVESIEPEEFDDDDDDLPHCPICAEAADIRLQVLHASGPDTDVAAINFADKSRHAAIENDLATFIAITLEPSGAVAVIVPSAPLMSVNPLQTIECSYDGACENLPPEKWCGACAVRLLATIVGDDEKIAEA